MFPFSGHPNFSGHRLLSEQRIAGFSITNSITPPSCELFNISIRPRDAYVYRVDFDLINECMFPSEYDSEDDNYLLEYYAYTLNKRLIPMNTVHILVNLHLFDKYNIYFSFFLSIEQSLDDSRVIRMISCSNALDIIQYRFH